MHPAPLTPPEAQGAGVRDDGSVALEDMQVRVERRFPQPSGLVWQLLTDVERMAGLGPEHTQARWVDAERGTGARFVGTNNRGGRLWEVDCQVLSWRSPNAFAWVVGPADCPTATWRYALIPHKAGCLVVQTVRHGPGRSLLRAAVQNRPEQAERLVAARAAELRTNMTVVLAEAEQLLSRGWHP